MKTVSLQIANCLDCPKSARVRDPGSADSFDQFDESLCCTLTPVPKDSRQANDFGQPFPGRIIVACERWESRFRKDATVPNWCPLLTVPKKRKPRAKPERKHVSPQRVLLFGKHKGKTLDEVADVDMCCYLTWMGCEKVGTYAERQMVERAIERWKRKNGLTLYEMQAEDATWD